MLMMLVTSIMLLVWDMCVYIETFAVDKTWSYTKLLSAGSFSIHLIGE